MKAVLNSLSILILIVFVLVADVFAATTLSVPKTVKQGDFFVVVGESMRPTLSYRVRFLKKWYEMYRLKSSSDVDKREILYAMIPVGISEDIGEKEVVVSGFGRNREIAIEISVPRWITIEETAITRRETAAMKLGGDKLTLIKKENFSFNALSSPSTDLKERYFPIAEVREKSISVLVNLTDTVRSPSLFGETHNIVFGGKTAMNLTHFGIDYDLPIGTPVLPIVAGMVRFSGEFFIYGKTIIIDHGHGLVSVYYHLSDILVNKGDVIGGTTAIGHSGGGGLLLPGENLHVGVKLHGVWINPDSLLTPHPVK